MRLTLLSMLLALTAPRDLIHQDSQRPLPRVWVFAGGGPGAWNLAVNTDGVLEVRPFFGPLSTRKLAPEERMALESVVRRLPKDKPSYQFGELRMHHESFSILVVDGFQKHDYALATEEGHDPCPTNMQEILRALAHFWQLVPTTDALDPRKAYAACWSVANAK